MVLAALSETGVVPSKNVGTRVGVDPGLQGAYAVLASNGEASIHRMPLAGGQLDLPALAREWASLAGAVFVLEKAQAMPKQGVTSSFTIGRNYGALQGILAALGIHYEEVRPTSWKPKILAGTKKDKDAAIAYVSRAFPGVDLVFPGCRKQHDGAADALCLAVFGQRMF